MHPGNASSSRSFEGTTGGAEHFMSVEAPAGLDLGAQNPEEIALSILSQIVALRRGGSAKPMMQREGAEEKAAGEAAEQVIRECDTGTSS